MTNGYSRSPRLLKGALIEITEGFIGPERNIIPFQYNPNSLTRTLDVFNPFQEEDEKGRKFPSVSATTQPFDPPEKFSLTLELDATDDLEADDPVAVRYGVADRIAALEMLLYPQEPSESGLLGSLSVSVGTGGIDISIDIEAEPVPKGEVPIVLFSWGPGRVVPVRLESFQIEEQAFSPTLYPLQAKVTVGMKVLSGEEINLFPPSDPKDIALAAYEHARSQKKDLAAGNV